MKMKKVLAMLLAVLMIVTATVAGTVAWLQHETEEVKNVFNPTDIGATLTENDNTYTMIPGHTIDKDPKAGVTANSVDAFLFVEVTESDNFDDFMTYKIADGWKLLDGTEAASINTDTNDSYVIYREVASNATTREFAILKDDQVAVKDSVTKAMMNTLTADTKPTLTFKAYTVQQDKNNSTVFTAAEAWAIAKGQATP